MNSVQSNRFVNMDFDHTVIVPSLSMMLRSEDTEVFLEGEISIGRSPECDLQIPDKRISRCHAIVKQIGGDFYVEDQQSKNGTFVNNTRISSATPIQPGDEIRFHESVFHVEVDRPYDPDATMIGLSIPAEPPAQLKSQESAKVAAQASRELVVSESRSTVPNPPDRLTAIERQLKKKKNGPDLSKTMSNLEIGSWISISDDSGKDTICCVVSVGSETDEHWQLVTTSGKRVVMPSDTLSDEMQYGRAMILNRVSLRARLAMLLSSTLGKSKMFKEMSH